MSENLELEMGPPPDRDPADVPDFAARARAKAANPPPRPQTDPVKARISLRTRRLVQAGLGGAIENVNGADVKLVSYFAARERPPLFRTKDGQFHPGCVAAMKGVEAFMHSSARTLTLYGKTGTGKTWAGIWTLAAADGGLWLPMDVDFRGEGRPRLRAAQSASLVVVNDLGTEPEDMSSLVANMICRRHDEGLRTIISTNAPPSAEQLPPDLREAWKRATLEARYGSRLSTRTCDVRLARLVHCPGDSMRLQDGAVE